MKTEYNQFIHVEGDAHIYTNVSGSRAQGSDFAGLIFGALGLMCAVGLLLGLLIHLLEMLVAWVAAHAVTIGITAAVVASVTGYVVYRIKKGSVKPLSAAPVADSVPMEDAPAAEQRSPVAPHSRQIEADPNPHLRIPSRETETIYFADEILINKNRHE